MSVLKVADERPLQAPPTAIVRQTPPLLQMIVDILTAMIRAINFQRPIGHAELALRPTSTLAEPQTGSEFIALLELLTGAEVVIVAGDTIILAHEHGMIIARHGQLEVMVRTWLWPADLFGFVAFGPPMPSINEWPDTWSPAESTASACCGCFKVCPLSRA